MLSGASVPPVDPIPRPGTSEISLEADLRTALLHVGFVPIADLARRLSFGELPGAIEDFDARAIQPHCVVPAGHRHEAIRNLAVAAAEPDVDRTVGILCSGDVV